jgi:hypothetical protein
MLQPSAFEFGNAERATCAHQHGRNGRKVVKHLHFKDETLDLLPRLQEQTQGDKRMS